MTRRCAVSICVFLVALARAQDIFEPNVFPEHPDVRVAAHILDAGLHSPESSVPVQIGRNLSLSLGVQNVGSIQKAGFRGWALRLVSDADSSQILLHHGDDVKDGMVGVPPNSEVTFAFSVPIQNVLPREARLIGVALYAVDAGDDGMSTHVATFINQTASLYESLTTKEKIEEGVLAGLALAICGLAAAYYVLEAFGFNAGKGGVLGFVFSRNK